MSFFSLHRFLWIQIITKKIYMQFSLMCCLVYWFVFYATIHKKAAV